MENKEQFKDTEKVRERIIAVMDCVHKTGVPYHIIFKLLSDIFYLIETAQSDKDMDNEIFSDICADEFEDLETAYDISFIFEDDEDDNYPYGDYGFEERDLDEDE